MRGKILQGKQIDRYA